MKQNEYTKQADEFCKATGTKISISFKEYGKHFDDDKECRNIYRVRIDRNHQSYSFDFGDSIDNTYKNERPTKYDVLACLTMYRPEDDVWDFAAEYGYNIDSKESFKRTERTFNAVWREWQGVNRLFEDVLNKLREIQ